MADFMNGGKAEVVGGHGTTRQSSVQHDNTVHLRVAFHIDGALETKAMMDEADALAAARPELQQRYIAQLEQAGTKGKRPVRTVFRCRVGGSMLG